MITELATLIIQFKMPNDSLTWCAGYKVGYEVGWAAATALGN